MQSCPSNTFSSSGACITCHPDCASCSGAAFNQCSSCPPDRPVLTNGRCLPTCSQTQFFDKTSSSCQSCDASCASCSGSGPSNCLACSSSSQVLKGGSCVSAGCTGSTNIASGLGVCLSDLVEVPSPTNTMPPLPSITGLDTPAPANKTTSSGSRALSWWEILLMTLGCAFIFAAVLMLWRRHARKKRAQRTALFASAKNLNNRGGWRGRLVRFGERLFGHRRTHPVLVSAPMPMAPSERLRMGKLREVDAASYSREMDKIVDAYAYSRAASIHYAPEPQPQPRPTYLEDRSMYSEVTHEPRRGPEPRQPVRNARDLLPSRFSGTSYTTSAHEPQDLPPPPRDLLEPSRPPTPAEEYARMVIQNKDTQAIDNYRLQPTYTGSTGGSRTNPFLRDPRPTPF